MKILRYALVAGLSVASLSAMAVSASAEDYNAYISYQTETYCFRNDWNEGNYGASTKYFDKYIVWGNTETDPDTYPEYVDYYDTDISGYAIPAKYTDTVITGDGVYTVKAKVDWGINGASTFNILKISTDIPSYTGAVCTSATVYIDGVAEKTYEYPYMETFTDYLAIGLVNIWDDNIGAYDGAYPESSVEIQFTMDMPEPYVPSEVYLTSGKCGDNVDFTLTEDGTLRIFGSGEMNYSYWTYPLWKDYQTSIKNIIIEEGVTTVGAWYFQGCYNVEAITLPNTLTRIDDFAFVSSSVDEFVLPESLTTIKSGAFSYSYIPKFRIPANVSEIGAGAFMETATEGFEVDSENQYFTVLDGSLYSKDMTRLLAYRGSTGEVPDGVVTIDSDAFNDVEAVIIPASVSEIGPSAFNYCYSLTKIEVDDNNPYFISVDGILFNKDMTKILSYPASKAGNSYTIPYGVTEIGGYAFSNSKVGEVIIPDTVTKISENAFSGCVSENITIPASVREIGDSAFYGCNMLSAIVIPEGVTSIGNMVFCSCQNLREITIPASVTTMGWSVFDSTPSLRSIYFNGTEEQWNAFGVQYYVSVYFNWIPKIYDVWFEDNTFYWNETEGAESYNVTVSDGVNDITDICAASCSSNLVSMIEEAGFSGGIYEVRVTAVMSGGDEAFVGTYFYVYSGSADKSIWYDEASNVLYWNEIRDVAGYTVTAEYHGNKMIDDCFANNSANFAEAMRSAGFCDGIHELTVTAVMGDGSERIIGTYLYNLTDSGNPYTPVWFENGILYWDETDGAEGYVVSAVSGENTALGECTESKCDNLSEILKEAGFASGVYEVSVNAVMADGTEKEIGTYSYTYTLGGCTDNSIRLENGVLYWDNVSGADYYLVNAECGSLKMEDVCGANNSANFVYIMNSAGFTDGYYDLTVTAVMRDGSKVKVGVYNYYFSGDNNSGGIDRGNIWDEDGVIYWTEQADADHYIVSLKYGTDIISDYCLSNCSANLNYLIAERAIPAGVYEIKVLAYYPDGTYSTVGVYDYNYTADVFVEGDNTFMYDDKADGTVKIKGGVIKNKNVVIPGEIGGKTVTEIADSAFAFNMDIETLIIPEGVKKLGWYAFNYCTNLKEVTLPSTLEYIDSWAFERCFALETVTIPASVSVLMGGAFSQNGAMTSINVDENNPYYVSIDGVVFTRDMKELVAYPAGRTGEYTVPETVNHIGDAAFYGSKGITGVTILGSLDFIGFEAFAECEQLTDLVINEGVNYVGYWAFRNCGIKKLTVPQSVTNIGNEAFGYADYNSNKIADFTLRGYKDSAVYFYALRHNIPFEEIGSVSEENLPFREEDSKPSDMESNPEADKEKDITEIIYNPGFNMKDKSESGVGIDISNVKLKANEIYDDEAKLKKASEALGETIKGNKHYNLFDLTLFNGDTDISERYDGLVELKIPIPNGHQDKEFYCYRIMEDENGNSVKVHIPSVIKDGYCCVYLEHFSMYAFVADEAADVTEKYAVNVNATKNGTVVADKLVAAEGETVVLTLTPQERFDFESVSIVTASGNKVETGIPSTMIDGKFTISFEMPAEDVTVTAVFTANREKQADAFVERLYGIMLNRESDAGKQSHVIGLLGGTSATHIAEGFVLGAELKAWNISNEEFVNRMYLTFLDRTADEEGKAIWVGVLDKGCSYARMLQDFCTSAEFTAICESYGFERGSFTSTEPRDINENITHYCSRMYTKALGRAYDVDGLNIWAKALVTGEMTPEEVAMVFLNGAEFQIWNHSDEVFVDRLYETLFNRPADADGKQTWLNLLAIGTTREDAIATFVQSQEFILLKQSLGL